VRRTRRADSDGQIVANWIAVFAEAVCYRHGAPLWPERLAVDSTSFVT
jgi:hypothetical protein